MRLPVHPLQFRSVFTPVQYTDTILVDGGVLNPIPIEHVLRKNGDILIVVNLYGEKKVDIPKEKILTMDI